MYSSMRLRRVLAWIGVVLGVCAGVQNAQAQDAADTITVHKGQSLRKVYKAATGRELDTRDSKVKAFRVLRRGRKLEQLSRAQYDLVYPGDLMVIPKARVVTHEVPAPKAPIGLDRICSIYVQANCVATLADLNSLKPQTLVDRAIRVPNSFAVRESVEAKAKSGAPAAVAAGKDKAVDQTANASVKYYVALLRLYAWKIAGAVLVVGLLLFAILRSDQLLMFARRGRVILPRFALLSNSRKVELIADYGRDKLEELWPKEPGSPPCPEVRTKHRFGVSSIECLAVIAEQSAILQSIVHGPHRLLDRFRPFQFEFGWIILNNDPAVLGLSARVINMHVWQGTTYSNQEMPEYWEIMESCMRAMEKSLGAALGTTITQRYYRFEPKYYAHENRATLTVHYTGSGDIGNQLRTILSHSEAVAEKQCQNRPGLRMRVSIAPHRTTRELTINVQCMQRRENDSVSAA